MRLLLFFLTCLFTATIASAQTDYLSFMDQAADCARNSRYDEAAQLARKALVVCQQSEGEKTLAYARILADLAGYYSHAGRYQDALQTGIEALDIRKDVAGEQSLEYAQSLNNVARYHSYLGHYMDAVILGRKAMELKEQIEGRDNADYAKSVSNLAGYLSRIGNYAEAIRLGEEALVIRERTVGRHHPDYAESLNNLAKYHFFQGDYQEAIATEQQALTIIEQLYGRQHPQYATALSNLSDYYLQMENFTEALRCGQEAMTTRHDVLGLHPDYAESLSSVAACHYAMGNNYEAVRLQSQALSLQRQLLGEEHPAYAQSLCRMATYFAANEQTDSAEICAYEATEHFTRFILNTFADLTTAERDLFWTKVRPWFTQDILQLAAKCPTSKMLKSAYNGTLLAKGLLLKSEQEMVNLLMESGDPTAVEAYRNLQASRTLLLQQFDLPKSQRTLNTDSLQRSITRQERKLVRQSKAYGNYTAPLRIGWDRILQRLKPRDVAIEFIHYTDDEGKGQYAALVVSRSPRLSGSLLSSPQGGIVGGSPVYVPLMNDEELASIPAKEIYTTDKLSVRVWKPLEAFLGNATRVFFAPAGQFYNIAIESLPCPNSLASSNSRLNDEKVMADRWQIYRLSSTREIVLSASSNPIEKQRDSRSLNSATIYGGMNYDAALDNTSDGQQDMTGIQQTAAKYLPATKKEAEEIYHQLLNTSDSSSPHVTLLTGEQATEQSLKQLSGHTPTLLHIATHGFYWTESDIAKTSIADRLSFLATADSISGQGGGAGDADKALTRSGLLFSGANHTLLGHPNRGNRTDDGVLTAREISLLDLRGLDLLVLSACQTGLGKVTGDGVFGLQRGFKKAGAQTLLMSLWKVDDAATRLLMTKFYSYLSEGASKHEALRRSQYDLRTLISSPTEDVGTTSRRSRHAISARAKRAQKNKSKKLYQDPYYWAAFILLDAIEE